jgi:GNAT superfamily N-acetyltransferase
MDGMGTAAPFVTAVDHPSLAGAFRRFLDELRAERAWRGRPLRSARTPAPWLIDRLAADKMMRLGLVHQGRLIAGAAVDNDGAVALAVVRDQRRRGVADELMAVVQERAAAVGYPPLHRCRAPAARLAG